MELRQIKAFVTLAETLNFTRAAELLYISQSTLSKQIAALEDDLGAKLLSRDTHSVQLTERGASFFQDAREVLNAAAKAEYGVRNFAPVRTDQSLKIGYDKAVDHTAELSGMIASLSVAFRRACPSVMLKIFAYESSELANVLQNDLIDLAIVVQEISTLMPFIDSMLNSVIIDPTAFVAVVKQEEKVDYSTISLPELLRGMRVAYVPPHQSAYSNLGRLFEKIGIFPFVSFSSSLVETILKVSQGEGFTICPKRQFEKFQVDGLVSVDIPPDIIGGDMRILWKKDVENRYIQEFVRLNHVV